MLRNLSLRARLLLSVLALALIGLATADVVTYASLDSFLIKRTDNALAAQHREVEAELANGGGGPGRLAALARTLPGLFVQTRTLSGTVLSSAQVSPFRETADEMSPPDLPKSVTLHAPSGHDPDRVAYFTAPAVKGGMRYRVRASVDPGSPFVLIIGTSLSDVDSTLHRLFVIELLVTAGVLLGIAALGLWLVRRSLRPLDAMGATAAAIAAGDLTRRVDVAAERTEVGRLGLALNAMLGHIESAFMAREASEQKLRRFVADASHELRTPLAAVRAYADLFRRGADRRPEDLQRAMDGISRESARMSFLVEDLLLLARLDEGRPLERAPVQLADVVCDAVETARAMEPDRRVDLDFRPVEVIGDRQRLRQVVDNLLNNTRAHTPVDAPVHVTLAQRNGSAVIRVEDSGPGMTDDQRERVFERFYRADPSRARTRGGAGLGLAIVSAVTKAHGGEVSVSSDPGRGSAFEITLPLSRGDSSQESRRAVSAGPQADGVH
jgi:two-component system, OmpR family, sensor kinase